MQPKQFIFIFFPRKIDEAQCDLLFILFQPHISWNNSWDDRFQSNKKKNEIFDMVFHFEKRKNQAWFWLNQTLKSIFSRLKSKVDWIQCMSAFFEVAQPCVRFCFFRRNIYIGNGRMMKKQTKTMYIVSTLYMYPCSIWNGKNQKKKQTAMK